MAAAASLKSLNKVFSIGKVGWIGIAAGIVLSIVGHLINANREANRLKNNLRDVLSDEAVQAQNATDVYKMLVNQLKNATVGSEEYNNILNKIQTRYGSYIGDIKRESDAYEQLSVKINSVSDALRRKAAESARDRGLTSIKESYAEDIKELEDKLVKNLMSNVSTKYTRGVAEGVATSFRVAMEEALNSGKTVFPSRIMNKVARNAGLDEVNIRNVYDYYNKLAKKLEEMHNEEVDFQSTIEKTFGETGKRAGIAMKELDNWRKSVKDFIGDNKNLLLFNPKDDENVDSWVERVLNRYKELVEERKKLQEMSSAGSPLFRSEELKSTEKNLSIITQLVNKFKLLQLPSFNKDLQKENKSGLKDSVQLMKEEVDLVARRWELYRKLYELTGNREGSMMAAFGGNVSFKSEIEELRSKLRKEIEASGKKVTIEELLGMGDRQLSKHGNLSPIVKKIKEVAAKISEDDMINAAQLINKYRDYEEKIVEIKRKANDDIRKLEEQRAKFGNEATDKAIAKRKRDEQSDILKTKFDQFKNSPEYLRAFEDLDKTSTGTLQLLLDQLEKFKLEAAESFDLTNMKEFVKIIESITDKLTQRDPFKALKDSIDEVNAATTRLRQAQNTVKFVKSGGNKVMSEAEALKELNAATDNYLDKTTKMKKAMSSVSSVMNNFSNAVKDLGGSIGGTAGEVISLIGDIGLFATESVQGVMKSIEALDVAATAGAKAVAAIESASVVLRIISTALQVVDKLKGWLSGKEDRERYRHWLQTIVNTQDAYNKKLVETKLLQEDVWGTKQIYNTLNAIKALGEATQNYNDKLNEQQKAWKDPSNTLLKKFGNHLTRGVFKQDDSEYVALKDNLRYITRTRKKGFLGIGGRHTKTQDLVEWVKENMDGAELFFADGRLNLTVAEALLENADNLAGQTEANLRALVEIEKQIQEAEDAISEYVSETFGSLSDSLSSSIVNAFRNGTDAAKSFRDSVVEVLEDVGEQILKNTFMQGMFDTYQERIKKAYENYSNNGGGQSESAFINTIANALLSHEIADATEELAKDSEKATEMGEKFLEMYKKIMGKYGFNVFEKDTNTPTLGKSVQSLTEDTGNLVASYLNATRADVSIIKMHVEKFLNETYPSVNLMAESQLQQLTLIANNTGRNAGLVEEIRDMINIVVDKGGRKIRM